MTFGEIIRIVQFSDYLGLGESMEIAKGKNEMNSSLKIAMRKIKRAKFLKNGSR
jgi:hypothetical protein